MIDTHPASTSTPTPSSSLPPNTQQQISKLTKKQKKAIAFRDKSSKKSKTKDTTINRDEQEVEMEDLHVSNVEKPPRTRSASASLQMGNVEDQRPESASRGSKKTSAGTKRTSGDSSSSNKDETRHQHQNPQQKRKRVSEVGDKQHSGDGDGQERPSKKSKRGRLDGVDDELDRVGTEDGIAKEKAGHKKRKGAKVEPRLDGAEEESEGEEMSEGEGEGGVKKGKGKQRFILFVGNLKYTTSVDAIQSHFSACDPPPEIRLLTPKASATGKTTTKSKGCAFLEFSNKVVLQQALKQHHSMLEDRMINVELTAGGGGKGEKRLGKLREKNKELLGQRKRKADKKGKKEVLPSRPDKPQRYSATSGMKQSESEHKRTWTVGDTADDEIHRGGQRYKKTRGSQKSRARDWGTGVNAIPVG